ncbi:hypothetical protein QQZ08_012231 [Neonectria magnoliae]|uniref:Uncharacterized protein n=1 Tax=Neonectria magnoliae TaxID=2732573 RepID=A0ABR1H401_9HYPO
MCTEWLIYWRCRRCSEIITSKSWVDKCDEKHNTDEQCDPLHTEGGTRKNVTCDKSANPSPPTRPGMCNRASVWSECTTCRIIRFVEYRYEQCRASLRRGTWCQTLGSYCEVFDLDAADCAECYIAALEEEEARDDRRA